MLGCFNCFSVSLLSLFWCVYLFDIFLIRYLYCIDWRENDTHRRTHMAWTGPTVARSLTTWVLEVIPVTGCPSKVFPILLTFSSPSDWTLLSGPLEFSAQQNTDHLRDRLLFTTGLSDATLYHRVDLVNERLSWTFTVAPAIYYFIRTVQSYTYRADHVFIYLNHCIEVLARTNIWTNRRGGRDSTRSRPTRSRRPGKMRTAKTSVPIRRPAAVFVLLLAALVFAAIVVAIQSSSFFIGEPPLRREVRWSSNRSIPSRSWCSTCFLVSRKP